MKKKDRWWNSLLIVLITAAIGVGIVYLVSVWWLQLPEGELLVSRTWLWLVIGSAYTAGWFVTRTVEDSFELIFTRNPFYRTGDDVPKDQEKYPPWLSRILWAVAYPLFFSIVAGIAVIIMVAAIFIYWVVNMVSG